MKILKCIILSALVLISFHTLSQNLNYNNQDYKNTWFFSMGYGAQMSGIKSEDFISSNITPAFNLNLGNWVTPEIAIQAGFQGFYFHTIADNSKHYYKFFYGEVLFNVNELLNGKFLSHAKWNIIFHPGAGYFYNDFYNQPNICANIGISNNFEVLHNLEIYIDISAIMGWDIYQGDDDILPSCILGISYNL